MGTSKNSPQKNLRPVSLSEYIGQTSVVKTLTLFLSAVKKRGVPTEHLLLYGPPGIGKTTLSYIIAHELKGELKITSGAALTKSGDLAAILTSMKPNDVLFIDEVHRLMKPVEETLYPVLEEYALDIVIGKGPSARTVRLSVPPITIIGATTKLAHLSAPLRDRFGLLMRLDYYSDQEMQEIILRSCNILGIKVTKEATYEIAKRSRKTPRLANRILKRARDVLEVEKHPALTKEILMKLFSLLEIDEVGLTDIDIQYLQLLGSKFQNVPVGVDTIALSLSEVRRTIEEFVEPYLLRIGFMRKTSRGRVLTQKGCSHIGVKAISSNQTKLPY